MSPNDIPSLASLRRKGKPAAPPQSSLFAEPASAPAAEPIFTVTQLVRSLRALVERTHPTVVVEGEISNWKPSASGHCYFTLKDAGAQLSIVLFRTDAARLSFRPKDGDAIRVRGRLSLYDPRGQLQLIATSLQPIGLGALLAAVQELKQRLRQEGLFDRHRPLPQFPRCIGVITSLHGAALRDIVKVCHRRHASVNLILYPVAVQGPSCAAEVTRALRWFAQTGIRKTGPLKSGPPKNPASSSPLVDVILIARGGGSFEDLHGFNAETVVRAIAASPIPVIAGIGHATDSVLADLAADVCAPTPSAAAELLTAGHFQLETRLARLTTSLRRAQQAMLQRTQRGLSYHSPALLRRRAQDNLDRLAQRADDFDRRRDTATLRTLVHHNQHLNALETRLERYSVHGRNAAANLQLTALATRLERAADLAPRLTHLARASHRLEALSPLSVLSRGYALLFNQQGRLVRQPADAPTGTTITASLATGTLSARVLP